MSLEVLGEVRLVVEADVDGDPRQRLSFQES